MKRLIDITVMFLSAVIIGFGSAKSRLVAASFSEVPPSVEIVAQTKMSQLMRITKSNYGGYNTPEGLANSNQLIGAEKLKNQVVTVVAKYQLSDGTDYYNYRFGQRYYWTDAKAFQPVYQIVKRENVQGVLQIIGADYDAYNIPSSLEDAKLLRVGNQLEGRTVNVVAKYQTSDGQQFYNFKFDQRYYWLNVQSFSKFASIIKKESIKKEMRITATKYDAFNTPCGLLGAKELLSGERISNNVIKVVAKYSLSNGRAYYNYQFNGRYYWTDVNAFQPEITVVKKLSIQQPLQIVSGSYSLTNIPSSLYRAKTLKKSVELLNKGIVAVAKYQDSAGEWFYNFKYGSRYYWLSATACTNFLTIEKREKANQLLRANSSNFGGYDTPLGLFQSHELLSGDKLKNQVVRAIAKYTLSNGIAFYNYKFDSRYYWTDSRAFENEPEVIQRENVFLPSKIKSATYAAYNIPAALTDAKSLMAGVELIQKYVTVIARYKVSDGRWFDNFKLGNRFYWVDESAFTRVAYVTAKQNMALKTRIDSGRYSGFNTPSPLPASKLLKSGVDLQGKIVQVVARYQVSNGESYYNFKLGNRYYWCNSRAFAKYGEVKLSIPEYVNQYSQGAPNGCEAAALFMGLKAKGKLSGYTFKRFLGTMPLAKDLNPFHGFGGSITSNYGFPAIFPAPLTDWGRKYGQVNNISGQSVSAIKDQLNQANYVVAFVTIHFKDPLFDKYWWGRGVNNNHAVLVDGYSASEYHVSDPIDGQYWIDAKKFESVYNARKWAVTVTG